MIGKLPLVNIGITSKANEIIENGVAKDLAKYLNPSDKDKLIIPKDVSSFPLYISVPTQNVISYLIYRVV